VVGEEQPGDPGDDPELQGETDLAEQNQRAPPRRDSGQQHRVDRTERAERMGASDQAEHDQDPEQVAGHGTAGGGGPTRSLGWGSI